MNLWLQFLSLLKQGQWVALPLILLLAALLTGVVKLPLCLISRKMRVLAEKTASQWDDIAVEMIEGIKSFVLFIWFTYLLSNLVSFPKNIESIIYFLLVLSTLYQVGAWGLHAIKHWKVTVLKKHIDRNQSSAGAFGLVYAGIQVSFIITIVLIGLSNLGVDIGALIAGLGVGGIAVALAAQNVLGDLLASLSIVLDKPFVIGDFIVVGDLRGTVEQIGIKTTRLRSLSGEQLIFSNKDLLESRVSNFQRMLERRVVKTVGVEYGTTQDHLQRIPKLIEEVITATPRLRFDRAHFCEFGASSLDFEIVFWVLSPDYVDYMNAQETVLQNIYQKFGELGISFAFPSQTLYLRK